MIVRVCLKCRTALRTPWTCTECGYGPKMRNGIPMFAPDLDDRDDAFQPRGFEYLAAVEESHFWFQARARIVLDAIGTHFSTPTSVLEVGCGTGSMLCRLRARFPDADLIGSEIHTQALAVAKRRLPDIELLQADARDIPFSSAFEVIGAFDVIEHITDDRAALQSMYHACRPGGGVVLTVPQHAWLWSSLDDFSRHKRRYTRRELADKLRDAGFRIVALHSFVSLLLPLLLVSRLYDRKAVGFDPLREFSFPALNPILGAVMEIERLTIRMGVRWPAGGSLLAVAVKDH